ncbi:MAG: hypothetical protein KF727_02545 [Microbacteriaceae bacterium]|nr:hypothetical protein [Microbacteriaceae bacterium]
MTDPRRAALLLALGTAVVLLGTGCAVPPPPYGAPSPTVTIANDGVAPLPVLPAGCADILPVAEINEALPSPVEIWADEDSTPEGFSMLAYRQAGGLQCVWGGQGGTDGVPDNGIQLWVTPDAEADFRAHATGIIPDEGDLLVTDTVGDASVIDCGGADSTGMVCTADVLVGDYWIMARSFGHDDRDHDTGVADWTALLTGVAGRVADSGTPHAVWEPPAGAIDGAVWCTDPALAARVIGADAGEPFSAPYLPGADLSSVVERAGGERCEWTAGDRVIRIETLQGGGWAYPLLEADGIGAGEVFPGNATAVDTALDGALVACGDGCNAVFLTGDSLVVVDNLEGSAKQVAALTSALAEIIAAGA